MRGQSPAMLCLPDTRRLEEIMKMMGRYLCLRHAFALAAAPRPKPWFKLRGLA